MGASDWSAELAGFVAAFTGVLVESMAACGPRVSASVTSRAKAGPVSEDVRGGLSSRSGTATAPASAELPADVD